MKSSITTFRDVRKYLSRIPLINCGGCGISALAMKRWLQKNNKPCIGSSFSFLEYNEDNHSYNKEFKSIDPSTLIAPNHVAFSFNRTKLIDCNSKINTDEYSYKLKLTEKQLVSCINNVNSWNYLFDRSKYLPIIARDLGIDLSDIKFE